ncbi:MAG: right-handed parallel beta-helix repeat-containing protein, partial [Thermoplasmata archaeon]
ASDELIATRNGCSLYITWDASNLYIGWTGTDWDGWGDFFAYFDSVSGGTATSVDWNGTHTLPSAIWDFAFCAEGASYWNLRKFDGTAWQADQPYTGSTYWGSATNNNTEMSIPFSDIGISEPGTATLNILIFAQWEDAVNVWNAFPVENPANNSGSQTFTHYYTISGLGNGTAPNQMKTWCPPIHINGDTELATNASVWNWPGNGSQDNPYIIKNYYIDAKGGKWGIYIENTSSYLVIQRCYITNQTSISAPSAGIALRNVSNAKILENTLMNVIHGMRIDTWSTYIIVENNTVNPNQRGIYPYQANYTVIRGNVITGGGTAGIYLNDANYAEVANNTITGSYNGTQVYSSENCTFMYNNISNCLNFGMYLYTSSKNN